MTKAYDEGESWKTGSTPKRQRMEAYLEWVITPSEAREPRLKRELAESLGVTVQTLANYDRDVWFQREVAKRSRGLFKATRATEVISTLVAIATDKEHKNAVTAARLLLEWMDKGTDEHSEAGFGDLSAEELAAKLEAMKDSVG
jgi:hypothetical protein